MQPLFDVVEVKAHPNYRLELAFENGERREFDMTAYMEKQPFVRLQDPALFCLAHVAYGTVVWPGNIDISPETLYHGSTAIGP